MYAVYADYILLTVNGEIKSLKYRFPDVYSTFQLYSISLKFVRIYKKAADTNQNLSHMLSSIRQQARALQARRQI